MFKRLMIGLVAVGLVVIFIAETANARAVRRRNTVENTHICDQKMPNGKTDLCYGADEVTDKLYGWDGENAVCKMTGTVVCIRPNDKGICTDPIEVSLTPNSFTATAKFVTETQTASDHTVLEQSIGQKICDSLDGSIFTRFWPNIAVAHTIYTDTDSVDSFPNIPGCDTTYELIELCHAQANSDVYECKTLWDSVYGADGELGIKGEPKPKFPSRCQPD